MQGLWMAFFVVKNTETACCRLMIEFHGVILLSHVLSDLWFKGKSGGKVR